MSIRSGVVKLVVSMTGKGNAEAKIRGTKAEMDKAGKAAYGLKSAFATAGVAVAAISAGFVAFEAAAREGQKAIRIEEGYLNSFQGSALEAKQAMEGLREATGHAIDDTSLQQSASTLSKLGLTAKDTRDLLALISTAELQATGTVEGVMQAVLKTAEGHTKALEKLGVSINESKVLQDYAESHGKLTRNLTGEDRVAAKLAASLKKLRDLYGNPQSVDAATTNAEKAKADLENKLSDAQVKIARLEAKISETLAGSLTAVDDAARKAIQGEKLTHVAYQQAAALKTLRKMTRGLTDEQVANNAQVAFAVQMMGSYGRQALDQIGKERAINKVKEAQAKVLKRIQKILADTNQEVRAGLNLYESAAYKNMSSVAFGDNPTIEPKATKKPHYYGGGKKKKTADEKWLEGIETADKVRAATGEDPRVTRARITAEVDAEEEAKQRADFESKRKSAESKLRKEEKRRAQERQKDLEKERKLVERLNTQYAGMFATLSSAGSKMKDFSPVISTVFGGLSKGVADFNKASKLTTSTKRVAGYTKAAVGSFEQITKALGLTRKEQAGIEIAVETAMSIADFASGNIPGGAGHAAAAVAWGAVLGTMPSGVANSKGNTGAYRYGASGSSSAASAAASSGSASTGLALGHGSGTTNIYVQGQAIGTAQQMGAVVAGALDEAARSGMGARV